MAKPRTPKKNAIENTITRETSLPTNGAATESHVAAAAIPASEPTNGDTMAAVRKSTRKPEIVKTDSRSNLFPINLEDEIRRLAYLMSERRGFEPGHETDDWLAAEHEVRQRYHHQQTA